MSNTYLKKEKKRKELRQQYVKVFQHKSQSPKE